MLSSGLLGMKLGKPIKGLPFAAAVCLAKPYNKWISGRVARC
jgi:hypothetical protein